MLPKVRKFSAKRMTKLKTRYWRTRTPIIAANGKKKEREREKKFPRRDNETNDEKGKREREREGKKRGDWSMLALWFSRPAPSDRCTSVYSSRGTKNEREIKKPLNEGRGRIIEKAGDSGNLANQIFAWDVRLKICNTMLQPSPPVRWLYALKRGKGWKFWKLTRD